ncbi:hypothetical protein GGR53DRAFT_293837 [Hypoxylon sp. FL1150]|nr:hypothetical protein GGR53DRAFT_293837 [Hypoxylon sp. FL1150]
MDFKAIDWDQVLLANEFRWRAINWRDSRADLDRVPWGQLQRDTVDRIARSFTHYDKVHNPAATPEITPAHFEQLRRLNLNTTPTINKVRGDWQRPLADSQKAIPRPGSNAGAGFLTVGYELELPIAVYHRGGIFAELPHPGDTRGEAQEIFTNDEPSERVREIVVGKVLTALNGQTDMVFVRKEDDEDEEIWKNRMETIRMMDHDKMKTYELPGVKPLHKISMIPGPQTQESSPTKSPTPHAPISPMPDKLEPFEDNIHALAVNCAEYAIVRYFPCSDRDRADKTFNHAESLLTATSQAMWNAVQLVPIRVMNDDSAVKVRTQAWMMVELYAYQLKVDKRYVNLEGMKPRHRAFSAYVMTNDIGRIGMRYATDGFYSDIPHGVFDVRLLYGWELVKLASPVMRVQQGALDDIKMTTSEICRVMRKDFRIHRDCPVVPTSMTVVVSHTNGFTLLELKKIITLYAVFEAQLNALNREYRCSTAYESISGSIQTESPLGKMSSQVTDIRNYNDPENIGDNPQHSSDPIFQAHMAELATYVPLDTVATKPSDRVFLLGIWNSANVTRLCKKATSVFPSNKTNLAAQCRGDSRSEYVESDPTAEYAASKGWEGEAFKNADWDLTDMHRGVVKIRNAASSLDPMHIANWIRVCTAFVDFAVNADAPTYRDAVAQVALTQASILKILGIPADIQSWYTSRVRADNYFCNDDVLGPKISWTDPFYAPF